MRSLVLASKVEGTGRTHLELTSTDGVRVATPLVVDVPLTPTADALAIAAALSAPTLMTGVVSVGAGVSSRVAGVLHGLFGESGLLLTAAAEDVPPPVSVGMTGIVDLAGQGWSTPRAVGDRRSIVLRPISLRTHVGRLFSLGRFVFAVAGAESPTSGADTTSVRAALAATLLVGERLGCDMLLVPRAGLAAAPRFEEHVALLGESLGITIVFEDEFRLDQYSAVQGGED